ncbi:hypothetical protein [Pendulispora albinea]|uniref:Uncharacterized protein n=1 Tax=Pendulispora albinea TaxID=2741071 RepID=A0ABZ2LWZ5_9BACT
MKTPKNDRTLRNRLSLGGCSAAALAVMMVAGSGEGCIPANFSFVESGDDGGSDARVRDDAAATGDSSGDEHARVGGCDPSKDFGPPELVRELSSSEEEGSTRLSNHGQVAYFYSKRRPNGSGTPWIFRSLLVGGTWGQPEPVGELNIEGVTNFSPSPSPDGTELLFESTRPVGDGGGDGRKHMWLASRPDTSTAFGDFFNLQNLNDPGEQICPYRLPDRHVLYYGHDGTISRVDDNGSGQDPALLAPVNVPNAWTMCPVVSPDELTMYVGSTRDSSVKPDFEEFDIWVSRRAQKSDAWSSPARLPNVNDPTRHDIPTWISDDSCTLYMQSARPNGLGYLDIYVARKPK